MADSSIGFGDNTAPEETVIKVAAPDTASKRGAAAIRQKAAGLWNKTVDYYHSIERPEYREMKQAQREEDESRRLARIEKKQKAFQAKLDKFNIVEKGDQYELLMSSGPEMLMPEGAWNEMLKQSTGMSYSFSGNDILKVKQGFLSPHVRRVDEPGIVTKISHGVEKKARKLLHLKNVAPTRSAVVGHIKIVPHEVNGIAHYDVLLTFDKNENALLGMVINASETEAGRAQTLVESVMAETRQSQRAEAARNLREVRRQETLAARLARRKKIEKVVQIGRDKVTAEVAAIQEATQNLGNRGVVAVKETLSEIGQAAERRNAEQLVNTEGRWRQEQIELAHAREALAANTEKAPSRTGADIKTGLRQLKERAGAGWERLKQAATPDAEPITLFSENRIRQEHAALTRASQVQRSARRTVIPELRPLMRRMATVATAAAVLLANFGGRPARQATEGLEKETAALVGKKLSGRLVREAAGNTQVAQLARETEQALVKVEPAPVILHMPTERITVVGKAPPPLPVNAEPSVEALVIQPLPDAALPELNPAVNATEASAMVPVAPTPLIQQVPTSLDQQALVPLASQVPNPLALEAPVSPASTPLAQQADTSLAANLAQPDSVTPSVVRLPLPADADVPPVIPDIQQFTLPFDSILQPSQGLAPPAPAFNPPVSAPASAVPSLPAAGAAQNDVVQSVSAGAQTDKAAGTLDNVPAAPAGNNDMKGIKKNAPGPQSATPGTSETTPAQKSSSLRLPGAGKAAILASAGAVAGYTGYQAATHYGKEKKSEVAFSKVSDVSVSPSAIPAQKLRTFPSMGNTAQGLA